MRNVLTIATYLLAIGAMACGGDTEDKTPIVLDASVDADADGDTGTEPNPQSNRMPQTLGSTRSELAGPLETSLRDQSPV